VARVYPRRAGVVSCEGGAGKRAARLERVWGNDLVLGVRRNPEAG